MAFNGKFIVNLAQFAANQGASIQEVLGNSPKSIEELCDDQCKVGNEEYQSVIERAIALTGDTHFGLHAGENLNLSAAGLIGQITQNCQTVKQALQYCCDFANLGCSVLPMSLVEESNAYKVVINPDMTWAKSSQTAYTQTVNGVLAFSIREVESLILEKKSAIKVHLPWPKPDDSSEYTRILNTDVFFDQSEIAIYLNKKHVESKVVNGDYDLLRILVEHAEQKMLQLKSENGFSEIVRQSLVKLIKPEFPTINQVAAHLNMSVRTLQRKLKTEGVTFQKMLNELRNELAVSYLKRGDLSIKEISYLLNYSEPSTFVRSFKSWSGSTPFLYRKQISEN